MGGTLLMANSGTLLLAIDNINQLNHKRYQVHHFYQYKMLNMPHRDLPGSVCALNF